MFFPDRSAKILGINGLRLHAWLESGQIFKNKRLARKLLQAKDLGQGVGASVLESAAGL
jgi:hypothetical protein